jgi:hypothetical protein
MGSSFTKINNTKIDLNNSNIRSNNHQLRPTPIQAHLYQYININEPKPTDNIWIGLSHVILPTLCCQKCNSWSSHHDQLHDERIRWQNNKNAQMVKMDEQHKRTKHKHYGFPRQSSYNRKDSNKRPNSNYNCDTYQDKRPRNDRDRPYFYDDKKKYQTYMMNFTQNHTRYHQTLTQVNATKLINNSENRNP